jgi:hypothetical protein
MFTSTNAKIFVVIGEEGVFLCVGIDKMGGKI